MFPLTQVLQVGLPDQPVAQGQLLALSNGVLFLDTRQLSKCLLCCQVFFVSSLLKILHGRFDRLECGLEKVKSPFGWMVQGYVLSYEFF